MPGTTAVPGRTGPDLSTFEEWLGLAADDTQPRRLLAVVDQPHLQRVRRELLDHRREQGATARARSRRLRDVWAMSTSA